MLEEKSGPAVTRLSQRPHGHGGVYQYWADRNGVELNLSINKKQNETESRLRRLSNLLRFLSTPIIRLAILKRQVLLNCFFSGYPLIQERLQAEYLRHRAASEIARGGHREGRKFQVGKVPGKRLSSLSDSRTTMEKASLAVREVIRLADPSKNPASAGPREGTP